MRYSIVQQPNQKGTKFTVDSETGAVTTNKVFDREGEDGKFVSVTVKATDNGDPSLEGVCSFTVEITDINDNPPLFDRQVRTGMEGPLPPLVKKICLNECPLGGDDICQECGLVYGLMDGLFHRWGVIHYSLRL